MKTEFPRATILGSEIRTLHSNAVGDDYEISIWLPPSYDTSKQRYSTLYVLDSPLCFGLAVSIVGMEMWDGIAPEMMVVGIGRHISSYDEWWPIRNRDYAPVALPNQPGSGQGGDIPAIC